ncbi:unnamed protein product [Notodromas monacha]|uniref:Protein YIPF n=1 Tax=Notodromas monacha TaxID=399045 RepID=A0A7R9BDQ7_9CRUS|nr:unnamed protein product [Notodromas monacha]CAG0913462.1 unnamed protein product [Notodromas monacha]
MNSGASPVPSDEDDVRGQMLSSADEGNLGSTGKFNTLDEPVKATLMRDVHAVGQRFKHVFRVDDKKFLVKDWDLWGPLILCTIMAILLEGQDVVVQERKYDGGPEFAEVFLLVWGGALVVTVNSHFLGGKLSYFQSVCIIGYCLLPLSISLLLCRIVLFFKQSTFTFFLRLLSTMTGLTYAVYASYEFMGSSLAKGKKALALYPVFLFYFIISWMVISTN